MKNVHAKERLTKKNLLNIAFHVWRQFDDPYYTGFAAQIAYFFFMASMPTLIVLSQVLGLFDVSLDFIKVWLETHVSSNVNSLVMDLFSATSVQFTNTVMVIVALWSASSLEFSLGRLESHVLTNGTYRFEFWTERMKAIPTAIISIAAIAFSLAIYVYGENIIQTIFRHSRFAEYLVALRLPIAAGLFFLMILMNYYLLPRIKVPIRCLLPGALFAWIGIMIVTAVYSVYSDKIAHYNILYGTFANIVALMLWFYLISWVLCIGMMFNKAWDEVMKRDRLTLTKMRGYLKAQLKGSSQSYENFFVRPDDLLYPELDSVAVKMSKRYVDGFEKEIEKKQQEIRRKQIIDAKADELYTEMKQDIERRDRGFLDE